MMFYQYTWCYIFFPDKSSSTSQFIKGKSRDLQKLLRYIWFQHLRMVQVIVLICLRFLNFQVVMVFLVFLLLFCFILKWFTIRSITININIVDFVSIIVPQNFLMELNNCEHILKDYKLAWRISRSSALTINVLITFDMCDLNGALFLNANFFLLHHFHLQQQLKVLFPLL